LSVIGNKIKMDQPPVSRSELWRGRLLRLLRLVRRALPFALGVLAAFLALWLYNQLAPHPHQLTLQEVNKSVAQTLASATPPPAYSTIVYQIIRPSLVLIETKSPGATGKDEQGLGSGVIVDQNGDILTSLHVIAGAKDIQVFYFDGTQSTGHVVTTQPENDIAVLQAEQTPDQLVPAVLGNPNAMSVGDEVYAVGNPFGLYSSLTAGVISGFNRTFKPKDSNIELKDLIQIDAAVNPGNSGGPLLNRYGQVIGIVEGILNPTDQSFFVGIGFAVPINIAGGAAGLPEY
jgi:S1-C subfamily serine protease